MKALGLIVNTGQFSEPVCPFDASFWDSIRADVSRRFRACRERNGVFGPGTVEASEVEYGGWTDILESLDSRWEVSPERELPGK